MKTIKDLISNSLIRLKKAGVEGPHREARLLMEHAISRDAAFVHAHQEYVPSSEELALFERYVDRRSYREPFHYIIGSKEFYGLDFEITPDVLIPRPETEMLVEESIALISNIGRPAVLEIGVGSGCVAVSILKHVAGATALGIDISESALNVARRNAEQHHVGDRLTTLVSDVYKNIPENGQYDLIVSNPPYVPEPDIVGLEPEVREYEPLSALTDGADGLGIIRTIIDSSDRFLRPGGYLVMEFGIGQEDAVLSMLGDASWIRVETKQDLRAIPRIVIALKAR